VEYFPYDERSQHDWDFYIAANSYISPYLLKNNMWPPKNSIKNIEADGIPVCSVIKRENKDDFIGYQAIANHHPEEAVKYFEEVIKKDCKDELIFYNFATVCYNLGDKDKTMALLQKGSEINPERESILMFRANIYANEGDTLRAAELYRKLISINRKYFDAYPALARIWIGNKKYKEARELLKACLVMHPGFREAIVGMADSYRSTDPDVAKKYDELAKTKQ
jgi:tetratricopeptide (TPR) repeat protein